MTRKLASLVVMAILLGCFSSAQEKKGRKVFAEIKGQGSLPPVPQWYSCTFEIEGEKPYDKQKAESCLREILKMKYFESGRVEVHKAGPNLEVNFILKAVSLPLSEVNYGIPDVWQAAFDDLMARYTDALRVGSIYEPLRETSTHLVLDLLLRKNKISGGVSKQLYLDYSARSARLLYHVWEGPMAPHAETWESLHPNCKVLLAGFSLFDETHNTPVNLIERLSSVTVPSCYSDSELPEDEAKLMKTGVFDSFHYEVIGEGNSRSVALHVRTKPLEISDVSYVGYGLLKGVDIQNTPGFPRIPLNAGVLYGRSAAVSTADLLKEYYERDGRRVKVFEEDQLTSSDALKVTFHILVFPADELYIDGQQIPLESLASSPEGK